MTHSIHTSQLSRNTQNTAQSTATVLDPDSNTGLRLHNPQKVLSSVDWLSVSFPILDDSSPAQYLESLRDFLTDYFGLEWDCEVKYFAGKFEGIRSLCGAQLKIAVEGSIISNRFVFVSLPGRTLQGFTVDKIAEFLGYCKRLRASVTRIDLAITVENPAFTMESLSEQVKKGNYCTKSQRFSEIVSCLRGRRKQDTHCISAVESQTRFCECTIKVWNLEKQDLTLSFGLKRSLKESSLVRFLRKLLQRLYKHCLSWFGL